MALVSIYIGGILTLIVAFYHTRLYKIRNWAEDFEKITKSNQEIFYTINIALALIFFMIGGLSILYAKEFSESSGLAFGFNLSYACFFVWRYIWGIVYQKESHNPKATLFEKAKSWLDGRSLFPI